MLRITRIRGSDSEQQSEYRLNACGFLGQGATNNPGFSANYNIAAGIASVATTDFILVAGYVAFSVMQTVAGANVELQVVQVDPELMTELTSDVVGAANIGVNDLNTFGVRSAVLPDRTWAIFKLRWRNTSAGVGATVSAVKLWTSAA